jgi:hypothetical protein
MFGEVPFGDVPFGSLKASTSVLVSACIHVSSQLLYSCTLAQSLVYTVTATSSVCPCEASGGTC